MPPSNRNNDCRKVTSFKNQYGFLIKFFPRHIFVKLYETELFYRFSALMMIYCHNKEGVLDMCWYRTSKFLDIAGKHNEYHQDKCL